MFSVEKSLDRYVGTLHEEREPDGLWHPSSISGCLRQAIYADRGEPVTDPRDDRSKRILRVGHVMHEFVQKALVADLQIAFFPEVELLSDTLGITGHCDGLAHTGEVGGCRPWEDRCNDGGHWEVIELKTINSNAFKYAKELPKPDHILQVTMYMMVVRETGGLALDGEVPIKAKPGLSQARIVYVSKDDLRISEHVVPYSEANRDEVLRRLEILNLNKQNGSLPDRLPFERRREMQKAWQCNYCPYATTCWDEGDW